MEFKRTITSKSTIKKQSKYSFDFDEEDIKQGRKATYKEPHFCKAKSGLTWFALYCFKNQLRANMLHSYDCFEEITQT